MSSEYVVDVAADTTLVTTAETVLATLSGVASQRLGQTVILDGYFTVNPGTTTSNFTVRVREDSLTGNVVDELLTLDMVGAVGTAEDHDIEVVHVPAGELSNKTYVLTVAQVGATANGTVTHARLLARTNP